MGETADHREYTHGPTLVAAARQQGLDFIALTDHNTISPLAEMATLGDDKLLTLGGQELTTFWGHAVCLGAHDSWLDWRVDREGRSMATIATQLYDKGQLYIIAHPYAIGDPYCTGCRWLYTQMMPGTARLIEVWNGPWFGDHPLEYNCNEDGLAFYYRCLNEGRRLVMTAGSDAHGPKQYERGPGFNAVYAESLSEVGILRALAAGHSYLSSGPVLQFEAQTDNGDSALMGDLLSTTNQTDFTVSSAWSATPPGATLRLIVNGALYAKGEVAAEGQRNWRVPVHGTRWCTLELRGDHGAMLAVTNPIFLSA
ncbi:MAG: CehA/McbA family metallohydrolase [Caldilineaceae bacterium]